MASRSQKSISYRVSSVSFWYGVKVGLTGFCIVWFEFFLHWMPKFAAAHLLHQGLFSKRQARFPNGARDSSFVPLFASKKSTNLLP